MAITSHPLRVIRPPRSAPINPVVHVRALFAGGVEQRGSGFVILQWPASIITARHVVMRPDGEAPLEVRVTASLHGHTIEMDAARVAYDDDDAGADVAVARMVPHPPATQLVL